MKEFQLSRYIKKWLPMILTVCIGLTVSVYLFLTFSQTYVASAVIQYNNTGAEEGLSPSGTELDVNEIKSSAVMSEVMNNLKLDNREYSIDELISKINIVEVIDEDEKARKEALLEEGEEYVYEPTTYIVSFEAKHGEGKEFARKVLDEVLDVYFSEYSEKYINSGSTVNSISGIYNGNYDYIEMMELIDQNISETLTTLEDRIANDATFRASSTGLSFQDLADRFSFLRSVKVSSLFSRIFEHQITKDKELLVSKYSQRIQNNEISNAAEEKMIQDVLTVINAYVEKMRESGNTNITYEYILDEVYNKEYYDSEGAPIGPGNQTVTYDKLVYSWRDHNEIKEYAAIDSAYCQYIIDVFSRCTGLDAVWPEEGAEESSPACVSSSKTCAALNTPGYEEIVQDVEQGIQELVDEFNNLYSLTEQTNEEYNEYLGAANISTLSTVSVKESINVALYTGIAAVFLLIVGCCSSILLGRLNDIVQYAFYTDHMTGMNNRLAFDNYLKQMDKRILGPGSICATLAITNQPEINRHAGREAGDELIRYFAESLREAFKNTNAFIVYNGKAQFVVIAEEITYNHAWSLLQQVKTAVNNRERFRDCAVRYEMGLADAQRDSAFKVRDLLSKAVANQKEYCSKG